MSKFIALRRRPRTAQFGLEELSFENKRMRILQEVPTDKQVDALESIGLKEVEDERRALKQEDKFHRLGYAGAYVIETPDEGKALRAIEVLEPEYHIMPDIDMGLPRATQNKLYERRPPRKEYWPEESGVALAHKEGITGKGVLVGILDTGCDADHLELRDKEIDFCYVPLQPAPEAMRLVRGFDTNGHGTHVTSIVAGKNVGVAPDVDLMVASVIESETVKTSLERVMVALDWMLSQFQLDHNADKPTIINLSLGFRQDWIEATQLESVLEGMRLLLSTLVVDFEVLPVAAIGNDGPGIVLAPGYFPECLSVGAVDFDLEPAWFSSSGLSPLTGKPEPDLAGYGVNVLAALERNIHRRSLYAEKSGTSMAAPYVAGIAALVASANPGLQGEALRKHLVEQALRLPRAGDRVGAGLARYP
jgi:subtilisin family serine protease